MIVSMVLAATDGGVIGRDNDLPWRLPADLKHFRRITIDHSVIMGRKTFDSMGKPLKRRRNIVVTRNQDWNAEGVEVFHGLSEALQACVGEEEVFIIGGSTIYNQALELGMVDKIYLTRVHGKFDGDTFFRLPNPERWELVEKERHEADEKNECAYTFQTLVRNNSSIRHVTVGT